MEDTDPRVCQWEWPSILVPIMYLLGTSPSETVVQNWDTSFDMDIVQSIFERYEKLAPSLYDTKAEQ